MPNLRFTRDKRGYENTFVVHAPRRQGRGRTRILYWYRTPPGIRIGRPPLDEEAIRVMEEHHPNIQFDWRQILKGEEESPAPAPRAERDERPRREQAAPVVDPGVPEHQGPAVEQLGSEGLARLRARYSHIIEAITRRVTDPARLEQLKGQAERLNPDSWSTSDDVRLGLEQYEAVFESLRGLVGRRRRRRSRSSSGGTRGTAAADGAPAEDSGPADGEPAEASEPDDESESDA